MAIEFGIAQVALNTQTTVDFTSAKLSQAPAGVLGFLGDGATNGTSNADFRASWGVTDGTEERSTRIQSDDGLSTTDTVRQRTTSKVVARVSNSDELSHNSFLTNGWRADLTNPGDFGKLAAAAMIGGSDVKAEVGTINFNNGDSITQTLSDTTLTPNVIILLNVGVFGTTSSDGSYHSFGIAHDTGSGIDQRCLQYHHGDGLSTTAPEARLDTTAAAGKLGVYEVTIDSTAQGQFTASISVSDDDRVEFLALQIDNADIALVDVDTPTVTGLHEETGPGFQPQFVIQALSMLTSTDSTATDATAGSIAYSMFNDTEAYCYSWAEEDGVGATNNHSLTHDRPVYYTDDAGAVSFDATFSQFTGNGWELNYGTADGTTRKGFALAVGPASTAQTYDVSVSLAQSLGFSTDTVATLERAVNLGANFGVTTSAVGTFGGLTTLGYSAGMSMTAGQTIATSVSLGIQQGLGTGIQVDLEGSVGLAQNLGLTAEEQAQFESSLSLANQLGAAIGSQALMEADFTLAEDLAVAAVAPGVLDVGLSLDAIQGVSVTSTVVQFTVDTPLQRAYLITIDRRNLLIEKEDRGLLIPRESRIYCIGKGK